MMLFILFSVFQLSSQPAECSFTQLEKNSFSFGYSGLQASVETESKPTKIISCRAWKENSNFVSLEVELGFSGTTKQSQPTYLYIFKKEGGALVKKFEYITKTKIETAKSGEYKTVNTPAELVLEKSEVKIVLPNLKKTLVIDQLKKD